MTGRHAFGVVFAGIVFLVLGSRVFGPGDLYDKDQPKTMSGTVDVALNGNWIWPRDMLLEPATKPPMYNWLATPVLWLAPVWDEWVFKVPSIVAVLFVGVLIARTAQRPHEGLLAAMVWFTCAPVMKQMYLSRPDMVLCAFLTGAWCFASRWRDSKFAAVGFWLCVSGAALTKGPPAILAVLYVVLAARLIDGRWEFARRMLWNRGAILFVILVGGWTVLAWRQRPDAFLTCFWNEGGTRFTTGGPEGISKPIYLPLLWFVNHFKPWSLLAAIGVLLMGWRNVFRHPLSPVILWCAIVLIVFSIIPGKRADYLLPAYPMAALLASYGLIRMTEILRIPTVAACAAPLLMAIYLAHFELTRSPEAKSGDTRRLVSFARGVSRNVQPNERLIFLVKAYHPLLSLLHRFDGNRARVDDLTSGVWVIAPLEPRWHHHAASEPLPNVIQTGPKQLIPGRVGLYRIGDDAGPTRGELQSLLASQYEWNFPPDRLRVTRETPLDPGASP